MAPTHTTPCLHAKPCPRSSARPTVAPTRGQLAPSVGRVLGRGHLAPPEPGGAFHKGLLRQSIESPGTWPAPPSPAPQCPLPGAHSPVQGEKWNCPGAGGRFPEWGEGILTARDPGLARLRQGDLASPLFHRLEDQTPGGFRHQGVRLPPAQSPWLCAAISLPWEVCPYPCLVPGTQAGQALPGSGGQACPGKASPQVNADTPTGAVREARWGLKQSMSILPRGASQPARFPPAPSRCPEARGRDHLVPCPNQGLLA